MTSSRTFTLLAMAVGLLGAHALEAPPALPAGFEQPFNPYTPDFCPERTNLVVPPAATFRFPFAATNLTKLIGNFSDPTWQGLIPNGSVGADNTQPGYELDLSNEPLDHREILDLYSYDPSSGALQQVSHTIPPVYFPLNDPDYAGAGPDYFIDKSHNVLSVIPDCDGQAVVMNLSVSYCMGGHAKDANWTLYYPLSKRASGLALVLENLWGQMLKNSSAPTPFQKQGFRPNVTCSDVSSTGSA